MAIPDWIHLDRMSGPSGETQIKIVTDVNMTASARSYTLTVTGGTPGNIASATIEVTQAGQGLIDEYLTFVVSTDGYLYWRKGAYSSAQKTIQYSKNDGSWTTLTSLTGTSTSNRISVSAGDVIKIKGTQNNYDGNYWYASSAKFSVKGNIMSMLYGDNFIDEKTLPSANCFNNLFYSCTTLTDASLLALPATGLTEACYQGMFLGCSALTSAPALKATVMVKDCYRGMFSNCISLTAAPALPATTLGATCYYYMFQNTRFTTPPELPATTLADGCYAGMFEGSRITTAPVICATTMAESACYNMFRSCKSLTTPPQLPATTLAADCYESMFKDCTSLVIAPVLPADTLPNACYQDMFYGCTSLLVVPEISATVYGDYSCYRMFLRCTSLGRVPQLNISSIGEHSCKQMFQNCTSLRNSPIINAINVIPTGNIPAYQGMGWMFSGCTNLSAVTCFTSVSPNLISSELTTKWLRSVSPTGTFTKSTGITWPSGADGIPSGWTVTDA